jgi:hypothetical protein
MKNNYIKIITSGKNELRTTMDINIDGQAYKNVNVKIDTGCPQTTILTSKLGISEKLSRKMKIADIQNNVKRTISFGVNDSEKYRKEASKRNQSNDILDLDAVSFYKNLDNISVGGVELHKRTVKINYDRTGNILIGMDILKDWDIHMGTVDSGETIFLACPKDQLNDEYFKELNRLFHTGNEIQKAEKYS